MPTREPDSRSVERLLRATAPPAAVTVDFRQRVVQASLDARLRQLSRRQTRRSACLGLVAACVMLTPFGFLVSVLLASAQSGMAPVEFRAVSISESAVTYRNSVDGYESAVIQRQVQTRLQNWLAAQRSSNQ